MKVTPPLPTLLLERALSAPDRVYSRVGRFGQEAELTNGMLYERASTYASALRDLGVRPADVVPIALPTSAQYVITVFAVQLLGAAIAPVAPPATLKPERVAAHAERLAAVAGACASSVAVVTEQTRELLEGCALLDGLVLVPVESLESGSPHPLTSMEPVDDNATALVQFSSGSTASPTGARIRYRNIAANAAMIGARVNLAAGDSVLSFLPLFHDFGLFAGVLLPFFWGIPVWLYDTAEFIRRPSFWFRALSRTRATTCPAPQFVYEVALHRVRDRDIEGVDLSAWRISYNGGEPIHASTLRAFNERFERYGLSPATVLPSYGMAEGTLAMAIQPAGLPFESDVVSRDALVREGLALPCEATEPSLEFVSCGRPLDGVVLEIVDDEGHAVEERRVGEIVLAGPSIADEYLLGLGRQQELAGPDGRFRTGDLGYLADGRVFVTGRIKDLIIRGGENFYPQDIERIIERLPGARLNGVVAFGYKDEETGRELVAAVVERDGADSELFESLPERARLEVFNALGLQLDDVVLVDRGWVPKTTSAKLQRTRARAMFLEGRHR